MNTYDILETVKMIQNENLDIRTITMGISLRDCCGPDIHVVSDKIYDKIMRNAKNLVAAGEEIEKKYGIPIINKRISVTPVALVGESCDGGDYTILAKALDRAAKDTGVNFIGGFSALVHKGYTKGDKFLIDAIPQALSETELVCSSVNVATPGRHQYGRRLPDGKRHQELSFLTREQNSIGCAKLVSFSNVPEDNPLWRGVPRHRRAGMRHQCGRIRTGRRSLGYFKLGKTPIFPMSPIRLKKPRLKLPDGAACRLEASKSSHSFRDRGPFPCADARHRRFRRPYFRRNGLSQCGAHARPPRSRF